jgi:hypothetical protein
MDALTDKERGTLASGHGLASCFVQVVLRDLTDIVLQWSAEHTHRVLGHALRDVDGGVFELLGVVNDAVPTVLVLQEFFTWLSCVVDNQDVDVTEPWNCTRAMERACTQDVGAPVGHPVREAVETVSTADTLLPPPGFLRTLESHVTQAASATAMAAVTARAVDPGRAGPPAAESPALEVGSWESVYGVPFPVTTDGQRLDCCRTLGVPPMVTKPGVTELTGIAPGEAERLLKDALSPSGRTDGIDDSTARSIHELLGRMVFQEGP